MEDVSIMAYNVVIWNIIKYTARYLQGGDLVMDVQFVNHFLSALSNVLPQLGFKNIARSKALGREQFIDSRGVIVNVGVTSQPMGNIVFNMTEESAKKLSSVMQKGAAVDNLDDLAQREICRMIHKITASAANSLYKSQHNVELASPACSVSNVKFQVCNSKYISFELVIDELMIEMGIGTNKAAT